MNYCGLQVGGRLIIPAAVMLELASASAATLLDSGAHAAALTAVSLSAPLILPALAAHSHVEASLEHTGGVDVRSMASGSTHQWTSHCHGSFTAVEVTQSGASMATIYTCQSQCFVGHPQSTLGKNPATLLFFSCGAGGSVMPALAAASLVPRDLYQTAAPPAPVTATVAVSAQVHLSGYRLHPALLDATLHLSAAALPPAGNGPAKTGGTLVPAGLGAILTSRLPAGCPRVAPIAQPSAPDEADGSALCSYQLLLPGAGCALDLCNLLAKQLMPVAAVPPQQAAAVEDVLASELLYETQWEAVHAERRTGSPLLEAGSTFELGRPARGSARRDHRLRGGGAASRAGEFPALRGKPAALTASFCGGGSAPYLAGSAAGAAARMLELWQRAAPDLAGGSLLLATYGVANQEQSAGAGRGGDGSAAAGAALWALARVIASENPSVAVSGVDRAPACSAHHAQVHHFVP